MEKLLDKYLELVEPYKFSSLYNKWAFITSIAACLERRVWINENAIGYLYPNLYVVFVGPPASRKTSTARVPINCFIRPMGDDGPILCSNQLTPATLIDELKAAGEKKANVHKTSPLFVMAGEFGVWFKDIGGGSMVDLLLEFFDSRVPGEVWKKNTKKWGMQEMPNPALTMLGCTTPREIIQSRVSETAGIGFTSRVIFVCEPKFIPGTTKFPPLDESKIAEIQKEFYRINKISGQYALGPGAEEAIEAVFLKTNAWMEEHPGSTLTASYMARKPVQVRKIAMILAAMRGSRMIIRGEDVEKANELMTETERTLSLAFGMQVIYHDAALPQRILDRIPWGSERPFADILADLAHDGYVIPDNEETQQLMRGLKMQGVIKSRPEGGTIVYTRCG